MKFPYCIALVFCLFLNGFAFEPFVKYLSEDLSRIALFPQGETRGMYYPGEKPSFLLFLKNNLKQEQQLRLETVIKDYEGKKICDLPAKTITVSPESEAQTTLDAPASAKPNYYILYMSIYAGKRKIAAVQSAYTVTTPFEGKRDPFFGLDKYGVNGEMVKAYERLGAGSVGICIGRKSTDDPDVVIPRRVKSSDWQKRLKSDLTLVGALWPTVYRDKRIAQRVKDGLPPLCDEEVIHYKKYVRRLVTELKDRVKVWMIMSEYDAAFRSPGITYFSSTAVLANHVLLTRLAYREIKKIQPDAQVAVLGMMGIDYYHTTPKFKLTKLILDDLKNDFDLLCIDAYNGNWHGLRGPLNLPENDFRNFLMDTVELSASYGRPRTLINAENGYAYDFRAGYNDALLRQIASFTARRLIINRSVPCLFNFWHRASGPSVVAGINSGKYNINAPIKDMGVLWKTINGGGKRKFAEIPLLPGAAYATTARLLAFAKPSKEIRLGNDIYSYTFTNSKNESVAALWSIKDPMILKLELPGPAIKTDLVGRTEKLTEGEQEILLTQDPVYLTLNIPVEKLNQAVSEAQTIIQTPVIGGGYMMSETKGVVFLANRENIIHKVKVEAAGGKTVSVALKPNETRMFRIPVKKNSKFYLIQSDGRRCDLPFNFQTFPVKRIDQPEFDGSGQWFELASQGELKIPDNVYPKRALIPEWGLFKWDGSDISADYALGYDDRNLYLGVRVKDQVHQQRYSGRNVWKDDALQIGFTSRYGLPSELRERLEQSMQKRQDRISRPARSVDYIVVQALGRKKDSRPCSNCSGLPRNGYLNWPAKVTRDGNCTIYEIAIPLGSLKLKPVKGSGLRFNFIVHDNNRTSDAASRYWLSFSPDGSAGVQDIAQYATLVFQ
ncbi:MAG: hypothetical protein J5858_12060 [Lentisphaeria bacterium]|nr:hypothetical protein [Lentisphaeria bacterium]